MVRQIRRLIAKEYARLIGTSTGGGGGFKAFWRDLKAGVIQKTQQFKAIERKRNKDMRAAIRKAEQNRALARRITA